QVFRQTLRRLGQREAFDRRAGHDAIANQEFVKRPQGAEAEQHRRAAEVVAAKEAEVAAEIVPLKFVPRRRLLMLFALPAMEFDQGLAIIAERVSRSAAVGGEVLEEPLDPSVGQR